MKIRNEYPPNIEMIKKVFDLTAKHPIYAFYPDIYNPEGQQIDVPLLAHEMVHLDQQKEIGVLNWWDRYLNNPAFRASQEILAYQTQYLTAKKYNKDRNKLFNYAKLLALDLSCEMYGKCLTFSEALEAIQSTKNYQFEISNVI